MRRVTAFMMLASCSGPPYYHPDEYTRTHPATADLVTASLTQGCPVDGAPAKHLRKSLGRPDVRGDSASALWRFPLDERSTLDVLVHADTVIRWVVTGRPSARIARRNYAWSLSQSEGFPERVLEFLDSEPDVDSRTTFLMLRGCAVPGLSRAAVLASWGAPSRTGQIGDTTHWIYGFGMEGQHDVIFLVSDTVRAFQSVRWNRDE